MLPFDTMLTFASAATLLAMAPGPDNIFVLTQSAVSGARAGLLVVLGLCTGLIFHSAAVALGIAALIAASPVAFTALKLAGAAYLLYLAYQAFRAPAQTLGGDAAPLKSVALYRRGLIMNITNPKVAIFFLSFFPGFLDPDLGSTIGQVVQLGLIFALVTFVVFGAVAVAAGGLSQWLTRAPSVQLAINKIAALVFIGLAAVILLGGK